MSQTLGTVEFAGFDCTVELTTYHNGNNALRLVDHSDGCPVAIATVNTDLILPKDEVLIKDYSENAGILNTLIDAGFISEPFDLVLSGYVVLFQCKLLKGV